MSETETVQSDVTEADPIEAAVAKAFAGIGDSEAAKRAKEEEDLKAKIAKFAPYVSGRNRDEGEELRKELDGAMGINRDYGADAHWCANPKCPDPIHGLRAARYLQDFVRVQTGIGRNVVSKTTAGLIEGSGGQEATYLVPVIYQQDLIPLLYAQVVVRNIGTPVLPMTEQTVKMPALTGGATASWSGEVAALNASNQTFAQLTFTAHDLLALTYFSNDLLMDSHPAVDQVVRDNLIREMALKEDQGFLIGGSNISANAPNGIYENNTDANTFAVQSGVGSVSVQEVALGGASITYSALAQAQYLLQNANVPMNRPAWVTDPYTIWKLQTLTDSLGNPLFRENPALGGEAVLGSGSRRNSVGTVLGIPVWSTTQMPSVDSKGGSNNGHAMILGDWDEAMIGDRQSLQVAMTSEAYILGTDGSGYGLFPNNASAIRVVERVDFQLKHPAAFCVISGIV